MGTSREGKHRGNHPKISTRAFYHHRASHLVLAVGLLIYFRQPLLVDSATCCVNSTSGLAFEPSCVCLVDNAQVTEQNLTRGESALYHWVLESSSSELITLVPRGNLTFRLSPCNGSARMDIKTASPASWPYMPSFSSRDNWNPATLTTSVQASEYAVFVTAGNDSDTTLYDIATYNTLLDTPVPGGGGLLSATMPTSSTAAVSINTSETGSGNSSYRLYWSSLYTGGSWGGPHGCTTPTDGVSLMNNSNCLFSSVCGMERAAEGWSDWEILPNGGSHSFEAPVTSEVEYIFNVAIRDSNNITFAYRASNMSFFLTTYQQCVSDPDCQSQLHDDTTIITVCAVVVVTLVMLLGSTKALRSSIRNTMEKATLTNARGQKFAVRGFRSSQRQASARADKYKASLPETPKLTPRAQQGRRVHMDYNDDDNGGGFGNIGGGTENSANNDEGHWEDTTDEPRSRRASTRLMKSPPSGHHSPSSQNNNDNNNDNSSAPGRQVTSRRNPRKNNNSPVLEGPLSEDEESSSNEMLREKEDSGGGGDGIGGGGGDNGSEAQAGTPSPRRSRKPDNRGAGNMMTKTKQDIRGGTLGGTGGRGGGGGGAGVSRSRRQHPSRRPVNNDSDEEEDANGEEKNAASSQFSPSRSRRNPASPGGAGVGRGNRGL